MFDENLWIVQLFWVCKRIDLAPVWEAGGVRCPADECEGVQGVRRVAAAAGAATPHSALRSTHHEPAATQCRLRGVHLYLSFRSFLSICDTVDVPCLIFN